MAKWFARLRSQARKSQDPPSRRRQAVLYTRQGCCLCDEAKQVLERHGYECEPVDIDQDPELAARYTNCVPVVVIDGKERFRGRVNEVLLKRLIAAGGEVNRS